MCMDTMPEHLNTIVMSMVRKPPDLSVNEPVDDLTDYWRQLSKEIARIESRYPFIVTTIVTLFVGPATQTCPAMQQPTAKHATTLNGSHPHQIGGEVEMSVQEWGCYRRVWRLKSNPRAVVHYHGK